MTSLAPAAFPRPFLRTLSGAESAFDFAFGQRANPWRHLGALGYYLFWICAVTGIWLFIDFDTSVRGARASVAAMIRQPLSVDGLAHSLHRYSADGLVLVMAAHIVRETVKRHYAGFRWFSWTTGVALIAFTLAAGVGGYWLPWDQVAQWSLTASAEWFDALPVFAGSLVRNFLPGEQLSDRFFSLLVFLHIGIPLAMLAAMGVHTQRVSPARTQPPRALALGTLAALLALSIAEPASLASPADLARAQARLPVDWFYLFVHPLMDSIGPKALWIATALAFALLAALPAFARKRATVARVSLANCNGCARCFADCPYGAVVMVPRSDARPHPREAHVLPDLCAGCGICSGACPSSTPFRRIEALVTGIDMPQMPIGQRRERLEAGLAHAGASPRIVVLACERGADASGLGGAGTVIVPFLCAGMIPPSFIEYALRAGADGVLVAACREGDCEFRCGEQILALRVEGRRAPALRARVPRGRIRIAYAGAFDASRLRREIDELRRTLPARPELTPPRRMESRHV